jgi:hypothetical protein
MINLNDPFYGVVLVFGIILLIAAYLALFGKVEDKKQKRH